MELNSLALSELSLTEDMVDTVVQTLRLWWEDGGVGGLNTDAGLTRNQGPVHGCNLEAQGRTCYATIACSRDVFVVIYG